MPDGVKLVSPFNGGTIEVPPDAATSVFVAAMVRAGFTVVEDSHEGEADAGRASASSARKGSNRQQRRE